MLGHGPLGGCSRLRHSMSAMRGAWCAWAPIISDEGIFIFAGSGPGEETCSFYARTSLLCKKHHRNAFCFTLMSYRESLACPRQRGWRCSEYEPLGTGPAAAETLIKMQPQLSTSSAAIIFYPFNEAALVLGDRFRDVPA